MFRPIDGRTIEVDCDSCAATFVTGRGEDGEPDEILCSECREAPQELKRALMAEMQNIGSAVTYLRRAEQERERDRVWFETFLSFPFKQLPAPKPCGLCDHPTFRGESWECGRIKTHTSFLFPYKQLPAPDRILADLDWAEIEAQARTAWNDYQDLMDTADQAAYYSPSWGEDK